MRFESMLPSTSSGIKRKQTNIQKVFGSQFNRFSHAHALLDAFVENYPYLKSVEFVEQLLEYFEFTFQTQWQEKERIPPSGRLVIIANQPLGTLNVAALFKLVSEVRSDVKIAVEKGKSP